MDPSCGDLCTEYKVNAEVAKNISFYVQAITYHDISLFSNVVNIEILPPVYGRTSDPSAPFMVAVEEYQMVLLNTTLVTFLPVP